MARTPRGKKKILAITFPEAKMQKMLEFREDRATLLALRQ